MAGRVRCALNLNGLAGALAEPTARTAQRNGSKIESHFEKPGNDSSDFDNPPNPLVPVEFLLLFSLADSRRW
ncbi:hypothetical protein GB937_008541 [Aspergillus fischeri]|nr:hypothetical protein GB937_008541 [Aspergillus fischeri]